MICETIPCLDGPHCAACSMLQSNGAFLTSKHAFHKPCQLCTLQPWVFGVVASLESSITPTQHCYLHALMPFCVRNCQRCCRHAARILEQLLHHDGRLEISCLSTSNTGCVASKWHHYISLLHYGHTTCDVKTAYPQLHDCEILPIGIAITAMSMRMVRIQLTLQSMGASASLTTLD
jgi:hypothetical protein